MMPVAVPTDTNGSIVPQAPWTYALYRPPCFGGPLAGVVPAPAVLVPPADGVLSLDEPPPHAAATSSPAAPTPVPASTRRRETRCRRDTVPVVTGHFSCLPSRE